MDIWSTILTIVVSILGSSGLWAFISSRRDKKDAKTRMLVGLAHDRILYLGQHYIQRGNITIDEYENLYEYLYKPYESLGGNGSAKRVIAEVQKLPIKKTAAPIEEV